MKIVVAPDSFKGSISAKNLCIAIRKGIHRVVPDAEVIELPLSDGGEGFLESLIYATNGRVQEVVVSDPLGRKILSSYGILGDEEKVVIEMAKASGLPLLADEERNPLITTTYGTGELIKAALKEGYRNIIIGVGGSGTNDGGIGMLKALGARFYDREGRPLDHTVSSLTQLATIDIDGLDPRIKEMQLTIASDVTNPLCGPNGATAIFAEQKGATKEMLPTLDRALKQFGKVIYDQFSIDILHMEGAGAGGGIGAALMAVLNGEMKSGIDLSLDMIHFDRIIKNADVIITGEGKLDSQTLSGKVISGVSKRAKKECIPTIALCGSCELTGVDLEFLNLDASFSIVPGPCSLKEAIENAEKWATERTEQIMRLITSSILFS